MASSTASPSETPVTRGQPATRDDVLVVIPTYNEVDSLEQIVAAVRAVGVRVLVVDDDSPDGTGRIAEELAGADEGTAVLHRPGKQGLGPAYTAGFAEGLKRGAAVLCEMDADLSHDPADLLRLIAEIDDGADVVIGSRYIPGGGVESWPWQRRLLSRGGNIYAGLMLGVGVRDLTSGFRAFRAAAVAELRPEECQASGYGFQVEMAWRAVRAGMDVREVPITFRDRESGESKMSAAIALEAMGLVTRWGLARLLRLR